MASKAYTNVFSLGEQKLTAEHDLDYGQKMERAIDVQLIDTNLYMSKELHLPLGARGVFGGQIVAQALKAAWDTVPDNFFVHSLHSYFILACSVESPVIYGVQRIRDGRSFCTRIVKATQKGKAIFTCICSFAKPEEGYVLNHQTEMPDVPSPESLPTDIEVYRNAYRSTHNPPRRFLKRLENRIKDAGVIEYVNVTIDSTEDVVSGNTKPRRRDQRWFRTRGKLTDDMKLHACSIAFASDAAFLNTATVAHGLTFSSKAIGMMTSLDHSIWFHAPARADDWLLYDKHSPRTNGGRGVAFGRIYSRDGTLIVTTAQEGVVRLSKEEQEKRLKEIEKEAKSKL
ncbi:unnamed protein product [Rhizopus microsporus]